MWPQIIGAGISAIGSLFGQDDEEKTVQQTVDYEAMAEAASKAGFNPLTAIRNGGSAGFTNTTHPALSQSVGFGAAFSTLGNALMSFDPRAEERAAVEDAIQRAMLDKIQKGTASAATGLFPSTMSALGSTRVGPSGKPVAKVEPGSTPSSAIRDHTFVRSVDGRIYRVPNIDVMPDDISGVLVGPAAQAVNTIADTAASLRDWLDPEPNPKPQGNPGPRSQPPLMPIPQRFGYDDAVGDTRVYYPRFDPLNASTW